jgi:hypothetical protein
LRSLSICTTSLGEPQARPSKIKAACEVASRITHTTKEDWVREFGERLVDADLDLEEFCAEFVIEVDNLQRRRFFSARRGNYPDRTH